MSGLVTAEHSIQEYREEEFPPPFPPFREELKALPDNQADNSPYNYLTHV